MTQIASLGDSVEAFFADVTWGQIIAAAVVATILSVITTLLIEYSAKPWLEVRKYKKLRDETMIDEILFKLNEVKAALLLIVEFNRFQSMGHIIPTHQHMLSKQLKHLCIAAEQIQRDLTHLPRDRRLGVNDEKDAYTAVASLEAAAIKTKSNIDKHDYIEFRSRNQRVLSKYLLEIDGVKRMLGGKDD